MLKPPEDPSSPAVGAARAASTAAISSAFSKRSISGWSTMIEVCPVLGDHRLNPRSKS